VEDKNKVKKRRNNELSVWCVKMKLKLVKIKKIERIPFKGYLYDITSLPYHNFLANDILVHNCEGTLGRRIQKGWREIPVKTEDGKTISIEMKMNVQTIEGLSGHSDRNQLLAFIHKLSSKPDRVIIAHGEPQKSLELARAIHKIFRVETNVPRNLESLRLK
jgi:predicted metal-dependent RNase